MKIEFFPGRLRKVCLTAAVMLMGAGMFSTARAADPVRITGTVKDASGAPVAGASVVERGTTDGVATSPQGGFAITADPESTLLVNFLGYRQQEIVPGSRRELTIVMETAVEDIETVVVVGYGTQKKATLTGAVAAIRNEEIVTTKNENVQNMLTGKVPGLRVAQRSSEPGQFSNDMDIRGFGSPLVVIDGVPRTNMARLDAEDIESISVLKDASAAIYGVRSANGVILITTKKGDKGRANISYSGNMTWQRPSNFPTMVDAADWMTLYNERSMHSVDNPTLVYSDDEINAYRSGELKSTNWRKEVFRNSAPQTQHTVSASGGTDAVTYYVSMGYQYQGSFLKTDAINYDKYTLRSNISANVTKNLKLDLNLAGYMDERNSSVYGSSDIVRGMWIMQPMDRVWYNEEMGQYWQPLNTTLQNPVAMMDTDLTGSNSYKSKWFQSSAALTYNIPYVEGLYVKGFYSYDYILNDNKEFVTACQLYNQDGVASTWNSPGTSDDPDNRVSRYYYGKDHNLWHVQLGFDRSFGRHSVSAMTLFENSHSEGDNFYGRTFAILPIDHVFAGSTDNQQFLQSTSSGALYDYANQAFVGRINYDFDNKYIVEGAFRYEGSSKFPADSRWAVFPSVSGGWRISEENFWKTSLLAFINYFKVRASWGKLGDDSASEYQFLTGYNYPASGTSASALPPGAIFDGVFVNSSNNKGLANGAITWYTSRTFNVGFDGEAWNGLFGVTGDYFRRKRTGLLTTRLSSLPGVVGATLPQENLNSDLTRGFEIEAYHRNRVGDFRYEIKGNVSFTRTKTLYYEQAEQGNSYLNWRNNNNNRNNNIWWGYQGDGRFTSWNDIYYSPVLVGRGTVIGDYNYLDWNGDGMISDLDVHPIGTVGNVPLLYFGLNFSAQWKGIDFTMLWQGAGKRYVAYRQFLYQPLWADTNAITGFFDRWHPADPKANPYDPATEWVSGHNAYTGTSPNESSTFNVQNAAYLRLKNIEIGYNLPRKWLDAVNMQGVRIYFSAYNLLTFSRLKYMDPEFYVNTNLSAGGLSDLGYNYPLNKTLTLGINVKF